MLCNKTMELHNHALMHAHVNTQLVETGRLVFIVFSFIESKFTEQQLCAPTWNTAVNMMELTIFQPVSQLQP